MDANKNPAALIRNSIFIIQNNPIIFVPLGIVAFIQLLCVEIIFFAPRYPLSTFFGPFIRYWHGEMYLHYPANFSLLDHWYHSYFVQYSLFIFIQTFFLGVMILIINRLNNDQKAHLKPIIGQTFSSYMSLVLAGATTVLTLHGLFTLYGLAVKRALIIRSESGIFYIIKRIVLDGSPYFQLLAVIFVTTLFAFLIPIIVLEKKHFFSAIIENFKNLLKSLGTIVVVVLIPLLLYLPIILVKNYPGILGNAFPPEINLAILIVSIFVLLLIDAVQYTAITTYYLLKREET